MTHSHVLSEFVRFVLGFAKKANTTSQGGYTFYCIVGGTVAVGILVCILVVLCVKKKNRRISPAEKESA